MYSTNKQLLFWAGFVLFGYIVGYFFKKLLLPILKKGAKITPLIVDDAILNGVQRIVTVSFVLAGFILGYFQTTIFQEHRPTIKKAIVIAVILLFTRFLIVIVNEIIHWQMGKMGKLLPRSSILLNLVNAIIIIFGLLFILQYLGISILPALTALGVGGLAVALALQDTLSNLFSGIQLLASQKIKVGDYIQLSDTEQGFLEDISWRNAVIRTNSNHLIILPNNKLATSVVKNFELPNDENSILVPVGVAYDSDLEFVEKITIEVAKEIQLNMEEAVCDHEPLIRYNAFGDSSINFNVVLRGNGFTSQFPIRHEFIKALHKRYKAEKIEIPFPIRTIYTKQS